MEPQGQRVAWTDIPADVRRKIEAVVGGTIVVADNQPGGFSPGLAARCQVADGRRCFVKAVSAAHNADSPAFHRREAVVARALPPGLPVPAFIDAIDDGGWVVLVFEDVDGRPPATPWSFEGLAQVFEALDRLAASTTPWPDSSLGSFAERFATTFTGFRTLAGGDPAVARVDARTRQHLDVLAALESEWEDAAEGDSLLHNDLRADNLLVLHDGSIVIVDWPHASVGPAWADKVCMLPSVGLDGGPSPTDVERVLDPFRGVDPGAVDRVVAALGGYFVYQRLQPPPRGLPTVRSFQRAQGAVALAWLAARVGLG